jgi:hypothetical protein
MRTLSFQKKIGDYFFPELLVLINIEYRNSWWSKIG